MPGLRIPPNVPHILHHALGAPGLPPLLLVGDLVAGRQPARFLAFGAHREVEKGVTFRTPAGRHTHLLTY